MREALRTSGAVLEIFATAEATELHADLRAAAVDVPWLTVNESVVKAVCDTVHPQGVVARCKAVDVPLGDVLNNRLDLVVVCADIRDPGNAGTIIRCADAAGADAVILTGNSVDPFNPKAVRASVGSVFHVPLVAGGDTSEVLNALQYGDIQVLAADGDGTLDLFADEAHLAAPTAWLFGNEAWGLPDEVRALADDVVSIPIFGTAESLNLAAAAAVCLYASARAQRAT